MYKLLYNPSVFIKVIQPIMTVDQLLSIANNALHSNSLSEYQQDALANLVRLNWMIQDLQHNTIQKPLLLSSGLTVETGDTRLMAASFNPRITTVPALLTVKTNISMPEWITVINAEHLGKLLNIDPKNIMLNNQDWTKQQLSWIEFAYPHTQNHMHDEQQRVRMISNYLSKQSKEFVFTREWLQTPIDWSKWASLRGH
jgi:hypothetical protein